ncbi:hypothetical protein GUJ93_ZPchr0007g3090 [Zizania palustris]|uniref:Pectin acetylesterase n=1 Tax=Zizania palustris TaxID=103762 RepID=A0A8J5TDM4_ZIZPA|nr:hypothetical protein GUJ93_ZPchr0007g3090 [Zizania palustris]
MGFCALALVLGSLAVAVAAVHGSEPWLNATHVYSTNANSGGGGNGNGVFVGLTLIQSAAAKGAVCLDGSLPGYHLHKGFGSGANSWLVNLEGGGWCNDVKSCVFRKSSRRGSSNYMEKQLQFTGIMSNRPEENPDFYNWNRVKVRYCDGGSFTGEGADVSSGLYFRGQRIWQTAMDDLMAQGMQYANQALLSGCSAGGVSTILHCDEFHGLFPSSTKVKCLADAGMFLDTVDVSGQREMRDFFNGIVRLQLQQSVAPKKADPQGQWRGCRMNHASCSGSQLQFLQGFRNEMLDAVRGFSGSRQNGIFINSCFAHCQSERQDTWYAKDSPNLGNKRIAEAVGDWFFERGDAKYTDCAYPCDGTCHHLVFRGDY